jgi:hypothetical protein
MPGTFKSICRRSSRGSADASHRTSRSLALSSASAVRLLTRRSPARFSGLCNAAACHAVIDDANGAEMPDGNVRRLRNAVRCRRPRGTVGRIRPISAHLQGRAERPALFNGFHQRRSGLGVIVHLSERVAAHIPRCKFAAVIVSTRAREVIRPAE